MAEPTIRYTGDGEFHSGIPARDLSRDEYDALDKEQRAVVRDSPLYDYAGYKDKAQAAKEGAASAPKDEPKAAAPQDSKGA